MVFRVIYVGSGDSKDVIGDVADGDDVVVIYCGCCCFCLSRRCCHCHAFLRGSSCHVGQYCS